jgi:2-polyprenyl-6-methoxyphenol hydroxylase-like FAD-dependent oxidoreductase
MYNTGTGEKIHEMPHGDIIFVSRRRMRKLCSEGIDIRHGMTFKGVSYENGKVQASFDGGEIVEGDLLVGCDGTRSVVREALLGTERAKRTLCKLRLTTTNVKYEDPAVVKRIMSLTTRSAFGYHSDGMFNMITSESLFTIHVVKLIFT